MNPASEFFGKLALPLLHCARGEKRFIYYRRYRKNIHARVGVNVYKFL